MTRISKQIEVTYEDAGDLDVTLIFDIEGDVSPAEPYSWGGSRGDEVTMRAELIGITIGAWTGDRNDAERMFGTAHLLRIDADQTEAQLEQYSAFEMAAE